MPFFTDPEGTHRSEFYITECTWMRKHGWRTPQWKLIEALEPDFHFKPPVELYNLVEDPAEYNNRTESEPEMVALLKLLHERKEQPVSRDEILDKIWGIQAHPSNRTVDNFIVKLRKKIEKSPDKPQHILTVYDGSTDAQQLLDMICRAEPPLDR